LTMRIAKKFHWNRDAVHKILIDELNMDLHKAPVHLAFLI